MKPSLPWNLLSCASTAKNTCAMPFMSTYAGQFYVSPWPGQGAQICGHTILCVSGRVFLDDVNIEIGN